MAGAAAQCYAERKEVKRIQKKGVSLLLLLLLLLQTAKICQLTALLNDWTQQ